MAYANIPVQQSQPGLPEDLVVKYVRPVRLMAVVANDKPEELDGKSWSVYETYDFGRTWFEKEIEGGDIEATITPPNWTEISSPAGFDWNRPDVSMKFMWRAAVNGVYTGGSNIVVYSAYLTSTENLGAATQYNWNRLAWVSKDWGATWEVNLDHTRLDVAANINELNRRVLYDIDDKGLLPTCVGKDRIGYWYVTPDHYEVPNPTGVYHLERQWYTHDLAPYEYDDYQGSSIYRAFGRIVDCTSAMYNACYVGRYGNDYFNENGEASKHRMFITIGEIALSSGTRAPMVFRSDNNGAEWMMVSNLLDFFPELSTTILASSDQYVIESIGDGEIVALVGGVADSVLTQYPSRCVCVKSSDYGVTWERLGDLPEPIYLDLPPFGTLDPYPRAIPHKIMYGGKSNVDGQIKKRLYAIQEWRPRTYLVPSTTWGSANDSLHAHCISEDGGETWEMLDNPPWQEKLVVDTALSQTDELGSFSEEFYSPYPTGASFYTITKNKTYDVFVVGDNNAIPGRYTDELIV